MGKTRRFQSRRSLHVVRPGAAALLEIPKGKHAVHWAGSIRQTKRQLHGTPYLIRPRPEGN